MLDKYEHFRKISKTGSCSLYHAEDKTSMQTVLIKRIRQQETWDELLKNHNVILTSKSRMMLKMIEIFKKNGYYFFVFEKALGHALSDVENIHRMPLDQFYSIFATLCENCLNLKRQNPEVYILPEWAFLHRNSIKFSHFQPFSPQSENQASKHVFLFNLEKSQTKHVHHSNVTTEQCQSLMFNLGLMAYHLLTGEKIANAEISQEHKKQGINLQACSSKIQKLTRDKNLTEMITKLIQQDPPEIPSIEQLHGFMMKQSRIYQAAAKANTPVEIYMKKLSQKCRRKKSAKFVRQCCQTIHNEQTKKVQKRKGSPTIGHTERRGYKSADRSFLPPIYSNRSPDRNKDTSISKPTRLITQQKIRINELS